MPGSFERVFTVTHYDDGPRSGVANYDDSPCLFVSTRSEAGDGFGSLLVLTPVSPDTFQLALEDWSIWQRWEAAFHAKRVPLESRPALPADRERWKQLRGLLSQHLVPDSRSWFCATATFRRAAHLPWDGRGLAPLEVRWARTGDPVPVDRLATSGQNRLNS